MSNPDLVQYLVEQASLAGDVTAKKMFGDYCLYSKFVSMLFFLAYVRKNHYFCSAKVFNQHL